MPRQPATHWNPPDDIVPEYKYQYQGKARCGRKLAKVRWNTDAKEVDCDRCVELAMKDGVLP